MFFHGFSKLSFLRFEVKKFRRRINLVSRMLSVLVASGNWQNMLPTSMSGSSVRRWFGCRVDSFVYSQTNKKPAMWQTSVTLEEY